jgi:hypothetical protein
MANAAGSKWTLLLMQKGYTTLEEIVQAMLYIEMSRDEVHGGGEWRFLKCVWAPTAKQRGAGSWPYWTKVRDLKTGDIVVHLQGKPPHAYFVGYSTVESDGEETSERPPIPADWDYADRFYRAKLRDYVQFAAPINLGTIFRERRSQLETYFSANKVRGRKKLNLFFVIQGGRLQCQNGAYLSDGDDELLEILFGPPSVFRGDDLTPPPVLSVRTGEQLAEVFVRLGQSEFSDRVRASYGGSCCFPGCQVNDRRFLVGSHIARWSDHVVLRGDLSNGLSLCLIHDKAFEIGLFTLDSNFAAPFHRFWRHRTSSDGKFSYSRSTSW